MTITNKHLVRVGHELAATMTADTPIIEIAKLVTRLATALDVQTALVAQLTEQRDAVVAESLELLNPANWLKYGEEGAAAAAVADGNGASGDEALLAGMKAIIACIQPTATSAIFDTLRAEGVEMFSAHCRKRHGEMLKTEPNDAVSNQAITAIRRAGEFALHYAAQLRESKGAQG